MQPRPIARTSGPLRPIPRREFCDKRGRRAMIAAGTHIMEGTMAGTTHIYAGVAGTVGMTHAGDLAGVLRQEAGSNKWEKLSGGLPQDAEVHAITVHPTDRDTVLVGSTKGLFRSTN